jgi:hypothetical protein
LNTVRTPSAWRTGATAFIAGWKAGANRNVKSSASRQAMAAFSSSGSGIPSLSSRSALPQRLDIERFPCFTTRTPQAAASSPVPVERLKLPEPSPPVPTVSTVGLPSGTTGCTASSRIAVAKPRISSALSPLARRAARIAPASAGSISAAASACIRLAAWLSVIEIPSSSRPRRPENSRLIVPPSA